MFDVGGSLERSLRRRGQFLVVVGALVGALMGVVLGLAVEPDQTGAAVAALGRAGGAAALPPSGQPSRSEPTGSGERADGDASTGGQRTRPADRLSDGHAKAGKHGEDRKAKPSPSKDKHDKGNDDKGKDK